MRLNLRALAMFLRDVCHPCRAVDRVVDRMVSEALDDSACNFCGLYVGHAHPTCPGDSELRFEETPLYHAVVSEMAEALADLRVAAFGDEDVQEWERELAHMAEGADE